MKIPLHAAAACIGLLLVGGCSHTGSGNAETGQSSAGQTATKLNALADQYYDWTLQHFPESAYFAGLDLERHDALFDNSLPARRAREREQDRMLQRLKTIDSTKLVGRTEWITHALLRQQLQSDVATRVCRTELWSLNHLGGWHLGTTRVAQLQPVGTAELRQQALARWRTLPQFVANEIDNLRTGLAQGYSAPQTVVTRVIEQVDGLLALPTEESPYYSMAVRDPEPSFAAATHELVAGSIRSALIRYRDFLADEYLLQARTALSITANPNGRECYEAALRSYTTIDRGGREVYELGTETVKGNRARVIELGRQAYGLDDFAAIIAAAKNDKSERFGNAEELLEFSRAAVRRAAAEMPNWVAEMPAQPVEVVPFEPHEEGTGRSAHYRPGNDERAGEYRIPLHQPENQLPGNAEATAFHEAWPGHHLQVATAQAIDGLHPVSRIIWFSGPGEGWARYSEALAEEMGLYKTTTGPILRRAWPARGMVVDPGLHLFGWTREQAAQFMAEAGRFPEARSDEMVDRIAVWPGQLTAYDSGGLEIFALRAEAEAALGSRFDIRAFHQAILENGTIPLPDLRLHIERWIERQGRD